MTPRPELVYVLCAATSVRCATLLLRSHRRAPTKLLMWSALCFVGVAVNNALLVADLVLVPALLLLTIGLVSEAR